MFAGAGFLQINLVQALKRNHLRYVLLTLCAKGQRVDRRIFGAFFFYYFEGPIQFLTFVFLMFHFYLRKIRFTSG
jgi:hypothetical protein